MSPKINEENVKIAKEMREKKATYKEIAEKLSVSIPTVIKMLANNSIKENIKDNEVKELPNNIRSEKLENFSEIINNTVEIDTGDDVKIPVSYENAEECVLGAFIQDESCAVLIAQSGLREEHFTKRKNKLLFPIVMKTRLSKGVVNFDLVADACEREVIPGGQNVLEFIGGLPELTRIINAPISLDFKTVEGYISVVFEQWRVSQLRDAGRWFSGLRSFNESQVVDKVAALQNILSEDTLLKQGLTSIDSLVVNAYNRFLDRKSYPEKYEGIQTGFYWMDKYHVISKKRTTIFGARTSVGKTILVSNAVTRMILNNKYVLLFTPELDKEEYIDRMICAEANVPIDDWKSAKVNEEDLKRISKLQQEIIGKAANNLYVEDKGVQTCNFILGSAKRHMLNHPVDVIVVDYIQKLKYYGEAKKAITDIVGNFYSFAKDNNVAMIIVSQLRRADTPEPELSQLKETGDLENFADCVVLLHRNSITRLRDRNQGWYKIAKNRQGATTDAVALEFNELTLKFKEIEPPEEESLMINEQNEEED